MRPRLAALLVLLAGCGGRGCAGGGAPPATVQGQTRGPVELVALVDLERDLVVDALLQPDGSFTVSVPPTSTRPWIAAHGPGGAVAQSEPLEVAWLGSGTGVYQLDPLPLWHSSIRVQRRGERLRLDWSPLPAGEGFPERRRYSVLVSYTALDGGQREVSLQAADPALEIDLSELLEYLPQRDPAREEVELSVRAFDPGVPQGRFWVACRLPWRLGQPLAAASESAPASE